MDIRKEEVHSSTSKKLDNTCETKNKSPQPNTTYEYRDTKIKQSDNKKKKRSLILKNTIIHPFSFTESDESYDDTVKKYSDSDFWEKDNFCSDNELHEHIQILAGDRSTNACYNDINIGSAFKFKKEISTKKINDTFLKKVIEQTQNKIFIIEDKKNYYITNYSFEISEINLFIFKNKVGFITIDICPHVNTIKSIMDFNYIIKSAIHSKKYYFVYKKEKEFIISNGSQDNEKELITHDKKIPYKPFEGDAGETQNRDGLFIFCYEFNFLTVIKELLKEIKATSFFNNMNRSSGNIEPKKALIFSSVIIEKPEDGRDLRRHLYYMRRVYKDSYLPSSFDLSFSKENEEIFQPFENSLWGFSKEACANIILHTGNQSTDDFFKDGYKARLDNYLFLYVLALNQYFGLIDFARRSTQFPDKVKKFDEENRLELHKISEEIKFFYLKYIYSEVSLITHQSQFYNKAYNILNIKKLLEEVHYQSESINSLIEKHEQLEQNKKEQAKEEKEKSNDFKVKFISVAALIFVLIATYEALWSASTFFADHYSKTGILLSVHLLFFISVTLFFLVFLFLYKTRHGCTFVDIKNLLKEKFLNLIACLSPNKLLHFMKNKISFLSKDKPQK